LKTADAEHGSVDGFLVEKAGVSPGILNRLREVLLDR
jgi:hypothetical protein